MAALTAQLILSLNKQTIKRTNNKQMRQVCAWVVALNKSRPKKGGFSLTSQLLFEIYQKQKFKKQSTQEMYKQANSPTTPNKSLTLLLVC